MQGNKEILEAKVRFKYALPLIIVLAIGLIFFSILEFVYDSTLKGPFYLIYYLITAITPIFYIFNAFIKSLKRCGKKKFSETRNLHVIMALYPIILFLSAILQIIYIDLPIICYVIVIALLCIYFRSLDNLISIDALTKLNKRNQIYSHIARISREVVFIDAD